MSTETAIKCEAYKISLNWRKRCGVEACDLEQEARLAMLRGRKSHGGPMQDFMRHWNRSRTGIRMIPLEPRAKYHAQVFTESDQMDTILREQTSRDLAMFLERLPERQMKILRYMYWDNMTMAEIGKILGVHEVRIFQLKEDALKKLRKMMRYSCLSHYC